MDAVIDQKPTVSGQQVKTEKMEKNKPLENPTEGILLWFYFKNVIHNFFCNNLNNHRNFFQLFLLLFL